MPVKDYENIAIGVKHCCGGELQAYSDLSINFGSSPKVVFDRIGNILSDERKHDENIPLTEEAAVKCFVKGLNSRDLANFYCMMAEDAKYFSEWASEEKLSKFEIIDYLKAKMIEVNKASTQRAVLGMADSKYCAVILNQNDASSMVLLFVKLSDENKISRIDVVKPQSEIQLIDDEEV